MPYPSGLSAQLMVAPEATVGTPVTVTTGYEFLDESFKFDPTFLEGMGLKAGQAYKRATRSITSRTQAPGGFSLEHGDRGHHGLQWKHALGSTFTTPTTVSGTAKQQIYTPGPKVGLSQTVQVGRPQTDGTVVPFTYSGVKTVGWEFSCADNAIAQFKLTMDGWAEATATSLVAAAFTTGVQNFSFRDCTTFKIGGTASTTTGLTSIASGVAIATIAKGITLTGATPLATERFGLGNGGVKKEQLDNAIPSVTGSLDMEFTSLAEIYGLFKAGTYTPLEVGFSHFDLAGNDAAGASGGANPYLLSFVLPSVKFKAAPVNVSGPDLLSMKVDFEAYDDGTNPPIQVRLVSTDTTI